MLTGVYYFPTDYGIDIAELARALEERGYDALFVCEHTHIPTSRDPATLPITVFAAPPDREKLLPYREAGIHRVLFEVPDVSRDEILRVLDKNAPLIAQLAEAR